ncbi:ArsR family transcriptional regulator [Candidatus Geothermarchaeota archaeon]|nr:MAG: ArsR family transcriptional regulator [Candidatus Geothermarchaeota archaeon]
MLKLEEIFSSKGATMIIKLLAEKEELNITSICRLTGLNHKVVSKYVRKLIKYGLVKEKKFGKRIRILALNNKNKYSEIIKEFIKRWKMKNMREMDEKD